MSRVSDVYDAWVALIAATLPAYKRLPNAYEPEENNELYLKKGFAVAIGPAENTERIVSNRETTSRTFPVVLVRRITQTDHATTERADLEKEIMEDAFKLMDALESDPQLGGVAVKAAFASDGGIEFLEGDRAKYYFTELTVEIEYFDTLTC